MSAVSLVDIERLGHVLDVARAVLLGDGDEFDIANAASPAGAARQSAGAFYTPAVLARLIVERGLDGYDSGPILDPTCGGGVVLLAAAEALAERGVPEGDAVVRLAGADVDPVALLAARVALGVWSLRRAGVWAELVTVCGDMVHGQAPGDWGGRFAAVVGNPPFLSQLRRRSARSAPERDAAQGRGYADAASLVLERSLRWVRPDGGSVALLQPRSFLVARDSAPIRNELAALGGVDEVWLDDHAMFDASVRVCLPVVKLRAAPATDSRSSTTVSVGVERRVVGTVTLPDWTRAVGLADATPAVVVDSHAGVLGDVAEVRADFRDWFYELAAVVAEAPLGLAAPDDRFVGVLTSGAIAPLATTWGHQPLRIAKRRFSRPVVPRAWLEARPDATWRAGPKVIVANQTKVIEAFADADGCWVGNTPTLSIAPTDPSCDVWEVAALLTSPVAAAFVANKVAGSGLSTGAMRLTAEVLRSVPLPSNADRWSEAAAVASAGGSASEVGTLMMAAYQLDSPQLSSWWLAHL